MNVLFVVLCVYVCDWEIEKKCTSEWESENNGVCWDGVLEKVGGGGGEGGREGDQFSSDSLVGSWKYYAGGVQWGFVFVDHVQWSTSF